MTTRRSVLQRQLLDILEERVFKVLDLVHVESLRTHIADYGMATWFDISQTSSSGWQVCMSDWKQTLCATLVAASTRSSDVSHISPL